MKKKYLGIICLLYASIIIYTIITNNLKNFLAPTMQIYIKLSLIPLIILGLTLLFIKDNDKLKMSDLILLLPLLMLIISGDARLNSTLASNRINLKNNQNTITKEEQITQETYPKENISKEEEISTNNTKEEKQEDIQKYDFTKPDINVVDASYFELANYLNYVPASYKYIGKTIKVRGIAVKNQDNIPLNYFALGKYTITCCAADASFLGFVVEDSNTLVEDNKWYEIEGIIQEFPDKSNEIQTTIKIINIKEIDGSKEEQYIYECYAYDNGSCAEISKYNLEYE